MKQVSIPFKRESGSKVNGLPESCRNTRMFQFPSNGKADPKWIIFLECLDKLFNVSIPFKRESGSKEKNRIRKLKRRRKVSIPFKRESGSKVWFGLIRKSRVLVSIPFKRESGSKVEAGFVVDGTRHTEFQFPSNGKADPKSGRRC